MNDLVELVNNKVVVSSRQIAKNFGKEHKHVLDSINQIRRAENSAVLEMFQEAEYTSEQNKKLPMFLMNRDGFSLLVMGFTGKEALDWKIKYIQAFNAMEARIQELEKEKAVKAIARAVSKEIRKTLTDVIRDNVPDSPNKRFIYKHYTDLIYKTIFGCNAKQLKIKLRVPDNGILRDYLTCDEIKHIEKTEKLVRSLIEIGWGYEQIKGFLAGQRLALTA